MAYFEDDVDACFIVAGDVQDDLRVRGLDVGCVEELLGNAVEHVVGDANFHVFVEVGEEVFARAVEEFEPLA